MAKIFTGIAWFVNEARSRDVHVAALGYAAPTGVTWLLADKIGSWVPAESRQTILFFWFSGLILVVFFKWLFRWNGVAYEPRIPGTTERIVKKWIARSACIVVLIGVLALLLIPPRSAVAIQISSPPGETEGVGEFVAQRIQVALHNDRGLNVIALSQDKPTSRVQADAELRGRVWKVGDTLLISFNLVNPDGGAILWNAGPFSFGQSNYVKLQDRADWIAGEVARDIRPLFAPRFRQLATMMRYSHNSDALRHYLRGRALLERESPDQLADAVAEFRESLRFDPSLDAARAGIADYYVARWDRGLIMPAPACDSANLALAGTNEGEDSPPEVTTSRGVIYLRCNWDLTRAQRSFETVTQNSKGYARAHRWLGVVLGYRGRFAHAFSELSLALKLGPYSPSTRLTLAKLLLLHGEHNRAIEETQTLLSLEVQPHAESDYDRVEAERTLALALGYAGRADSARAVLDDLAAETGRTASHAVILAQVAQLLGDSSVFNNAIVKLDNCYAGPSLPAYRMAWISAKAEQDSAAYEWLLLGAYYRDHAVLSARYDHAFDGVRKNSRFKRGIINPRLLLVESKDRKWAGFHPITAACPPL